MPKIVIGDTRGDIIAKRRWIYINFATTGCSLYSSRDRCLRWAASLVAQMVMFQCDLVRRVNNDKMITEAQSRTFTPASNRKSPQEDGTKHTESIYHDCTAEVTVVHL